MKKSFCDVCNAEVSSVEQERIKVSLGRVSVEVLSAVDGVWNKGDVCHSCIRLVVANGKRTPEDSQRYTK